MASPSSPGQAAIRTSSIAAGVCARLSPLEFILDYALQCILNWKGNPKMQELSTILPLLRAARQKDRRPQAELAALCGCSQGQISRILSGKIKFMHQYAYRLCECLGVPQRTEPPFDFDSHLAHLETVADSRQQELILVIRHAYERLQDPRALRKQR